MSVFPDIVRRPYSVYPGVTSPPVFRPLPATVAGLAELMGCNNPTDIYLCQDASGNLTSVGGGNVLTANGTPTYQNATGLLRNSVGADSSADNFTAATGAVFNSALSDFAFLVLFRIAASADGNNRIIYDKRDTATQGGYYLRMDTNGNLWFLVHDGNNFQLANSDGASTVADGNWHAALSIHNDGTGITQYCDFAAVASDTTPALVTITSTDAFTLLGGTYQGTGIDIAYLAHWSDITNLDATAFARFWEAVR